ncbi:hypothetical protein K2D_30440 [Planctomycetes bacterium K2D]|uniref:Uncharacterized protein n=1 Tax=Botrimarina mediterranea TaxID=2528022 RepID=A0A518KAG9_9BACT|nr:hypothetical protein Spa11_29940 [Botrimarina mediterranea]QDV79430.1 hypothetical protein K2D_30440 [Planctomycetes bacterium K2D]
MPVISVSHECFETAARLATIRAAQAGWRLAGIWREGLAAPVEAGPTQHVSVAEPVAVREVGAARPMSPTVESDTDSAPGRY